MKLPPALQSFIDTLAQAISPDVRKQATLVYSELVVQARDPWLYEEAKVPDTIDGRFELLVLHMFLYLRRFKDAASYKGEYDEFEEAVLALMFDDMDQNLREMGVGDMGIPRRIKAMAEALYGRFNVYERTLASKDDVREALIRNIYGEDTDAPQSAVDALQAYLGALQVHFAAQPIERLMNGLLKFSDPEAMLRGETVN